MKKATLPVLALAALIIASCAKEKDGYDKNLTKDTWTLSTATTVNETVTKRVFTNGDPNTTNTQRTTTTISGGQSSVEDYELDQETGTADFFTKLTTVSALSLTYKFEEDGNFQADRSTTLKSTTTESTGNPATTVTVTAEPSVSTNTGLWSWQNTGDQKSLLSFDLGSLQVITISKSELTLKVNTSSTSVTKPSSSETKTVTSTNNVDITFTK